jgi:hypothetical protein
LSAAEHDVVDVQQRSKTHAPVMGFTKKPNKLHHAETPQDSSFTVY